MKIIVQKFGGSSVKDAPSRAQALQHVQYAVQQNQKVVVVVSAIRQPGAPYSTDALLDLVDNTTTKLSKRELDMLVSVGEIISATVFAEAARKLGLTATALSGREAGILTNSDFQNAKVLKVDPTRILRALKEVDVVVVAGFQGADPTGEVTTLGRGGSDVSAAILAAALKVPVDIFSDVDGIMTADPQLVKQARCIKTIGYEELANLAHNGARVIHPRAVEVAKQANLTMRIRATYQQPNELGTLVCQSEATISHYRTVTGITDQENLTQFSVHTQNLSAGQIFQLLASKGLSVDFININGQQVIFNLPEKDLLLAKKNLTAAHADFSVLTNCAKVAIVGAGIAGTPGITARIVNTLAKQNIKILQSADSYTTIWVLIQQLDLRNALNALHDEFMRSHQFSVATQ
ncbi:aspartate kinase [Pediococcus siamensis]|uniref:aspartate kinase n=1 Tax=Pediococcus siamensis TaxID=381829 RepID=UPI0039A2962C